MADLPRGVRNNNPGNIRSSIDKWQGLSDTQNDTAFFQFKDPVWGIRAIASLLIGYQNRAHCHTPYDFISRYSPPGDHNPTDVYAARVATAIDPNMTSDMPIDVKDYYVMKPMVQVIITQENGLPWDKFYSDAQIDKALMLAGIEIPKKSLAKSRTIAGATTASTAVVVSQVLQETQNQLQPLIPYADVLKWVFLAVAVAGLGLTMWAKIDERRKGIS